MISVSKTPQATVQSAGAGPVRDMGKRVQAPVPLNNLTGPAGADAAAIGERRGAFETLVLSHLNAAYTLARYLTRSADFAEDIVQEALLRAYRGFDSQRGDNVRAWLLAIVRNCFLSWKTRDRQGRSVSEETDASAAGTEEYAQDHETPESILMKLQESSAIRAVIEGLPHVFREVLVLRDLEDLSYREIAEVTGVPVGTVMSRLARARKMFAAAWKNVDMTPAGERLQ